MYFSQIKTLDQLKKAYREWALKLHPDRGGNEDEFKAMQAEYERRRDFIFSKGTWTEKQQEQERGYDEELRAMIDKVINLSAFEFDLFDKAVQIEVIGNWLWISGHTYPIRDFLKKLGFRFSSQKRAWHWHTGEFKKYSKKRYSIEEIRNKYGSERVEKPRKARKAALKS